MRTVFLNGEIEQYLESRAALIDRFTSVLPSEDIETAPLILRALLDDKLTRDGLLARWSEADVEKTLVEMAPRRVTLASGWSTVPVTVHRWLDLLADSGLLDPCGSSLEGLHKAVDRATPAYLVAMAEPSEWGSAKFWSIMMAEHCVDLADETAVEQFFRRVDDGAVGIDDDAMSVIEQREDAEPEPAQWLPPIPVAHSDDRFEAIADNALIVRLGVLVDWIGPGRDLDDLGELSDTDHGELSHALDMSGDGDRTDLLLEWARRAHLVTRADDRLVATRISTPLLEEPQVLWERMWDVFALLDDGIVGDSDDPGRFGDATEVFATAVTSAVRMLYSEGGPVPLEFLVSTIVLGALPEDAESPGAEEVGAVRGLLRRICEQWELMGAVHTVATRDPEMLEIIGSVVAEDASPDPTMVELLPLGTGAARRSLEAVGYVAPSMEDIAGHSAEVAVCSAANSPDEVGDRVCRSWTEARGARTASADLAALLSRVDDPLVRLGALSFLADIGSDGVTAVRGLVDDPVAGAAARVWMREHAEDATVTTRPDDEVLFQLDCMAVAADDSPAAFLERFRLAATTNQIAMVEEIVRAPHARRDTVLDVIANGHPDKRVAGVARRSLERTSSTRPV